VFSYTFSNTLGRKIKKYLFIDILCYKDCMRKNRHESITFLMLVRKFKAVCKS